MTFQAKADLRAALDDDAEVVRRILDPLTPRHLDPLTPRRRQTVLKSRSTDADLSNAGSVARRVANDNSNDSSTLEVRLSLVVVFICLIVFRCFILMCLMHYSYMPQL